ncbi:MAG: nuclear transport factor 2 family protein [Candidatus Delongbacteria bacterium]
MASEPGAERHPQWERVEAVIRASIAWADDKDLALLYDSLVPDARLFLFHPDDESTIAGFPAFQEMAERVFLNPAFRATGFCIRELRIDFSPAGDVAWFSARLDDHGEWDGRPIGWENARWTGVLVQQAGQWKIIQMHFSLPTG